MPAIKVRAVAVGHYGALRKVGDVFTIVEDAHLGSWMEPVDPKDAERLAARVTEFRKRRSGVQQIRPDVPATTGMLRDPVQPKPSPEKPAASAAPEAGEKKPDDDTYGL